MRILPFASTVLMEGRRVHISDLVRVLAVVLSQLVIDRTGLTGTFDIQIQYSDEVRGAPSPDSLGPPLFTALREQLGLKLQATKGPVEFLVLDPVELPAAN